MKICRKCKIEYKEDYLFCPKCGTPYDKKQKRARTPMNKVSNFGKVMSIILYALGGIFLLSFILNFKDDIFGNVVGILFALSLFDFIYKIIESKCNTIDEKWFKLAKIIIPIILFFAWIICSSPTQSNNTNNIQKENVEIKEENQSNNENQTEEPEIEQEENNAEEEKEESQKQQVVSYELKYGVLGEFGKMVEYEGEDEPFYYFPSGTYKIEVTKMDKLCFLWIDYNQGYDNSPWGTAYNNKEKLQFTHKGHTQTTTLTDDVHIYNSNNCNYRLTKMD